IANTPHQHLVRGAKLPSGTTYRYVFSPPGVPDLPYLLFLHGYPESSYDWYNQISHFAEQGYGVIVPDLLGYGGTDDPSSLEDFNFRNMTQDLGQLLDCEGIQTVFGISHDFGAPLLSRFINYYPERLTAVAFLGNGYIPPQARLDIDAITVINNASVTRHGYPKYGYWLFNNNENDTSSDLLLDRASLDSFYTVGYTSNSTYMRDHFAPIGALAEWLRENRTSADFFTSPLHQENWKKIVRAQGGLKGPLKWYQSMIVGINNPQEDDLTASGIIPQPALFVGADRDAISIPSEELSTMLPFASNIRIRSVDCGHFLQLEAPNEVNAHLDAFIRDVIATSTSDYKSISSCWENC
ncbi:Alpha/Beta hydrolase protein, partial [Boeremia exigua]|uniref:Alpha/Beta hydrolase protein n=1 Tax=Boeremia exigua TaxID=749465 RepID=UPI001E8D86A4